VSTGPPVVVNGLSGEGGHGGDISESLTLVLEPLCLRGVAGWNLHAVPFRKAGMIPWLAVVSRWLQGTPRLLVKADAVGSVHMMEP
jgi:hypothetical protein